MKEDGHIQWVGRRQLWNQIRAFNPWPGSFTRLANPGPQLLKIWKAEEENGASGPPGTILQARKDEIVVACGQNALRIAELQVPGGRRLGSREFLAGHKLPEGAVLA